MDTSFPAVYYRMPHEKDAHAVYTEQNALELNSLNDTPDSSGFIFHPFAAGDTSKSYFIKADRTNQLSPDELYKLAEQDENDWEINDVSTSVNFFKNREEHCKNIAEAVKEIRSGQMKKVVLSRMKRIKVSQINPLKVFYKLCRRYPAAFVSLVYIPGEVLWLTATPELLVAIEGDKINTVSLAGTKPADSLEQWNDKEKMEQQVVTDYIHTVLQKYCTDISVSGPTEVIAGNVKHLKSSFSAKLNSSLWDLVSALHPTPAVCGIPLEEARQFILQTEGYDRKYYTGFLGVCNMNGKTNLFVNLRCAEIKKKEVNLYIGGGITKDSVPEKEWEETELKSKTLLFAFEEK